MAHPSEVTGLAFDTTTGYLAAANREGIVQLYAIDGLMSMRNIFSTTLGGQDIPKAIAFGQTVGNNKDLLVFGLHHGTV
jgi:hypothetical protein